MNLELLAILGVIAQGILDLQSSLTELTAKVQTMSDQQAELNTDVANLVAAITAVSDEIAALKSANPAVDFTSLETAIGSLQALAPPATPPAS